MSIQLKDGSSTQDVRLDRLEHFDDNSRSFDILSFLRHRKKKDTPKSYTWRCIPHINQGRQGSCAGHALAHLLSARPHEHLGLTHENAVAYYHEAQRIDPWPGGSYEGANPRYEGTSILAIVKIGQEIGYYSSYHWAFGIDQLISGIGHHGPAILGIPVYEGMFNVDYNGYIHATGKKVGGHAILCKGVNIKYKYFTLHNSWGVAWGRCGDCRISFDDMKKLLKENGEAVFVDHKI